MNREELLKIIYSYYEGLSTEQLELIIEFISAQYLTLSKENQVAHQ